MKLHKSVLAVPAVVLSVLSAHADEEVQDVFGQWRVSVGGAFNAAPRGNMNVRNVPQPRPYVVTPSAAAKRDAWMNACSGEFDGNAFIRKDSATGVDDWPMTENWMVPTDSYNPDDNSFHLKNAYHEEEVVGEPSFSQVNEKEIDGNGVFGISAEVSRELWISNEAFEQRWGVDFAAAFSYFFQHDFYHASGRVRRDDSVRTLDGYYETVVDAGDSLFDYLEETDPDYQKFPINGMYGYGNDVSTSFAPQLRYPAFAPDDRCTETYRTESASTWYRASGDYRELEMLFMFRPWYEITDWWRVYGELGVGVSWGRFETDFYCSNGLGLRESFDQWDVYGVGGLGTMFRFGMFDLSLDFLGRFLRDDMDVDGRYVRGSIQRADWGFRVMAGFEF